MTDGWRCADCGTIVVENCTDADDVAIESAAETGQPVAESSGHGCPLCPYMTQMAPVAIEVYTRDVYATVRGRLRPVPLTEVPSPCPSPTPAAPATS